jgi:hypothetical protein
MNRTLTARTRVGTRRQLCGSVSFLATPFHFDSEEHRGTLPAGVAENRPTRGPAPNGSFTKVAGHRCTRLSRPVALTVAGWSKSEEDPR